jgi:GntR family transcriptional regulator
VRRALEALREEGLIDSRQGFGWFVAGDPFRQQLRQLGTIESQLQAAGHRNERQILSFRFTHAPASVAAVLGGGQVLEVARLNLADSLPFAVVTVWCPEALAADLSRADVERATFLEQLPVVLGGATQSIGADAATTAEAHALKIPEGSPVLVATRVTSDEAGTPVLVSRHVFPAHRTEFVVELPAPSDGLDPEGLRLLEEGI